MKSYCVAIDSLGLTETHFASSFQMLGLKVMCYHTWLETHFYFFEIGFLCVDPAVLKLTMYDQASFKLQNIPTSASRVLRLKVCTTNVQLKTGLMCYNSEPFADF